MQNDNSFKKEVENFDLNVNKRLLEIQQELVELEKRRSLDGVDQKEKESVTSRIKFLVEEERLLIEARYKNEKEIKGVENIAVKSVSSSDKDLKEILQNEIKEEEIIKDELKELKHAAEERRWYETFWGRLIIIIIGGAILAFLGLEEFTSGL